MKLVEAIRFSFVEIKEKPLVYIIGSLLLTLASLLFFIPMVGPFLVALVYPYILRYIAKGLEFDVTDKLNTAIKAFLIIIGIPGLLIHLLFGFTLLEIVKEGWQAFLTAITSVSIILRVLIVFLIIVVIGFLLTLLFGYSAYGSIIKKVDRLKVDVSGGAKIILISLVMGVLLGVLSSALSYIPLIGRFLSLLFEVFLAPVISVAAIFKYIE